jgi:hypothetical protein
MIKKTRIEIQPPNFQVVKLRLEGVSPLMLHKFSEKSRKQMEETQQAESKTKKKRAPKDYKAEYLGAKYISTAKWEGIPALSIRAAMIRACSNVDGLPMTVAKGAFFIKPDGFDVTDGTPLVRIHGKSVHDTRPVRLESGVTDLRNRPRYDSWACEIAVEFDADLVSANDVANLLARAGTQIGIGELRPFGRKSFGGDFGMWCVKNPKKGRKVA